MTTTLGYKTLVFFLAFGVGMMISYGNPAVGIISGVIILSSYK